MRNILLKLGLVSMGLGSVVLTACQPIVPPEQLPYMKVKTDLPASIGATEDLSITIHGVNGCNVFDKVDVAFTGPNKLSLFVRPKTLNPCPAVPNAAAFDYTFVSKASSPRSNPFEVWVNDEKVGTVQVK